MQVATASAVDSAGNVVITGYTEVGASDDDFYTIKVKADGSGTFWTAQNGSAAGNGIDHANSIAIDDNDDVIVGGLSWNGNNYDLHIIKYASADGTVVWEKTIDSDVQGSDSVSAIAVDVDNNIYIAGLTQSASAHDDCIVIKLNPADGTEAWRMIYDGASGMDDRLTAIAAGPDGIVAVGYTYNQTNLNYDYLTLKYAYSNGALQWSKVYNGAGNGDDRAKKVKIDNSGDVVVGGYAFGTTKDIHTIKYDGADGNLIWENNYDGSSTDDLKDLWIDAQGDVYITGTTFTNTGFTDFYTAKYSGANGDVLWENEFHSEGDNTDIPVAIGVDDNGDVFVTGYTHKSVSGDDDFQTVKYQKDNGNQLCEAMFDGPAGKDDQAIGLGITSLGKLYVAGWSDKWTGGSSDYDYYAIHYDVGEVNCPTNLTATVVSNTEIHLTWEDNSDNEDGFKLERSISGASFVEVADLAANTTSYSDTNLTPHTWYTYRARSYNSTDFNPTEYSRYSNEAQGLTTVIPYSPPGWIYFYDGSDNGDDYAESIAVGPDNNPVVTGSSNFTLGTLDYYTVKIDRSTAVAQWELRYGSNDNGADVAKAVAVDSNNDVIVSGYSDLYSINAGQNTNDIYTLKYLSTGDPGYGNDYVWADQYDGPGHDDDRAVAIATITDNANNVVVVGYGKNKNGTPETSDDHDDIYLIKYAPDGSKPWPVQVFDGGGNDYPASVITDLNGDIILTGRSYRTYNGDTNYDIITRKYNGSTGALIWSTIYDNPFPGFDGGVDIAADASGNIYVAGSVSNASGDLDTFLEKYNGADGTSVWGSPRFYDGPAHGLDEAVAVGIDPLDGGIVVGGSRQTSDNDSDFHLLRYNPDGSLVWEKTLELRTSYDEAKAMAIDSAGNICLAGNMQSSGSETTDILAIKYDHSGNPIKGTIFDGTGSDFDEAVDVAVNSFGEAFIAGYTTNLSGNADYVVLVCEGEVFLPPGNFSATAGYTHVDLSWVDSKSTEDGYKIERKDGDCSSGNAWSLIHTTTAGVTSYTDTEPLIGFSYCYQIYAYTDGLVSRSLQVEVSTPTPGAPDGLSGIAYSTNRIDLSWNDNTDGETGFEIERCAGDSCTDFSPLATVGPGVTGYQDDTVCEGSTYRYVVRAVAALGDPLLNWQTDFSEPSDNVISAAKTAPVWVSAEAVSEVAVQLYWNDTNVDESGFVIARCEGATCDFSAVDASFYPGAGVGGYLDTDTLLPGTTYRYQIKATKTTGCTWDSLYSAPISVTTAVIAPSNVQAAVVNTTRIDVTWNDNTGSESYFEIERCEGSTCDFTTNTISFNAVQNTTSKSDNSVAEGTTYRYRVRAIKSIPGPSWESDYSAPSDARTTPAKTIPSGLNAVTVNEARVDITWNDTNTDESGFQIDRCQGAGCSSFTELNPNYVANGASITYSDTGLTLDTTYCYQVRAYKTAQQSWVSGNSTNPITSCATTAVPLPQNLTAYRSLSNTTRINLYWNDTTTNENGFEIERCTGSTCNDFALITTTVAGRTYYYDDAVAEGTYYNYRIRAIRTVAPIWQSGYTYLTGGAVQTYPKLTPTMGNISRVSEKQINITWSDSNRDETGYKIDRCMGDGCDFTTKSTFSVGANTYSYADTNNLLPDTKYRYRVQAYKSSTIPWESAYTAVKEATTTLNAPNGLYAGNPSTTSKQINWTDNTASETGFEFERCEGATCTSFTQIAAPAAGITSYQDEALCQGTDYKYRVRAVRNVAPIWQSDYSAVLSTSTLPAVAPVLTASLISESQIDLAWTDPTPDRTGFDLERCQDQGSACSNFAPIATGVTGTSYSDSNLSLGATYRYRVVAKKTGVGCEWSVNSNIAYAATEILAPSPLEVTQVNTTEIDLSWVDQSDGETGFEIERCLGHSCAAGDFSLIYTAAADQETYTDDSVCNGTAYSYRVRAIGDGWESAYTDTVETQTSSLGAATNLVIDPQVYEGRVDLSWSDNALDETGLVLERCEGPSCDFTTPAVINLNQGTLSTTDNGLVNGTTYCYRIKAVKAASCSWESDYSNTVCVFADYTTPMNLTGTVVDTTSIALTWVDTTLSEDKFVVERCAGPSCSDFAQIGPDLNPDTENYTDIDACPGTAYTYRVKAGDTAATWEAYSDEWSGSTNAFDPAYAAINLTAVRIDEGQIELSWESNPGDETGFTIERCSGIDCVFSGSEFFTGNDPSQRTYSDFSVVHDEVYRYQVVATKIGTCRPDSDPSNIAEATYFLEAPSSFTATAVGSRKIRLDWAEPPLADAYEIEAKVNITGSFALLRTVEAGTTFYVNSTGMEPDTEYTFRIRSAVGSAKSVYSPEASATTDPLGEPGGDDSICN